MPFDCQIIEERFDPFLVNNEEQSPSCLDIKRVYNYENGNDLQKRQAIMSHLEKMLFMMKRYILQEYQPR